MNMEKWRVIGYMIGLAMWLIVAFAFLKIAQVLGWL